MPHEDEVLEEAKAVQEGQQQLQDTQNQMLAAFASFTEVLVGVLPKSPGTCITEGVTSGYTAEPTKAALPALPSPNI